LAWNITKRDTYVEFEETSKGDVRTFNKNRFSPTHQDGFLRIVDITTRLKDWQLRDYEKVIGTITDVNGNTITPDPASMAGVAKAIAPLFFS